MMTVSTILVNFHILGAIVTGLGVLIAWVNLVRGVSTRSSKLIMILAILTSIQVMSGSALSILAGHSVAEYCTRVVFYMVVVAMTEFMLMRQVNVCRPSLSVILNWGVSCTLVFLTLLFIS